MRRFMGRRLRLELVAGLGIALALPALAAGSVRGLATETTLAAQTRDLGGRTQVALSVTVTGQDGLPATGAVAIEDRGTQVAGVALDAQGHAATTLSLPTGAHSLTAVYMGDAAHQSSVSPVAAVQAQASGTPSFTVAVTPATLTLTAGQSGSAIASVTPVDASALTAPMFVTLSCSGMPDQSSCNFTPENIEIQPNTTAAVTSTIVFQTQAASSRYPSPVGSLRKNSNVAWAVMLPGVLGLGGLAFGARRRRWLSRLSLLALVGLVSVLGSTACAARYNYYNHGPPYNLPTPSGTYTININAQSSNGITATTQSTSLVLTVQ